MRFAPCCHVLALIALLLSRTSSSAHAQHATEAFTVIWLTPPECLQTEQIEAEISRLVGAKLRADAAHNFRAHFSAGAEGAHQLVLEAGSEHGESVRTVNVRSCQQLREVTVVLIAASLDPHGALSSELTAPEPAAPERLPERAPLAWSLIFGASGDMRSLPRVSGGPSAGAALELTPTWWLWLDVRYLLPRAADTDIPEVSSAFQLLAGALGAAHVWRLHGLAFGPCAEVELGYLHGAVQGAVDATGAASPWVSAIAGGVADYRLSARTSLQLRALFGVPLYRPRFGLEGEDPFHTTAPYTVRVSLGLRIALGPRTAAPLAIQKSVALVTP